MSFRESVVRGKIGMNGPAAHVIGVGEEVVIMGFEMTEVPIQTEGHSRRQA